MEFTVKCFSEKTTSVDSGDSVLLPNDEMKDLSIDETRDPDWESQTQESVQKKYEHLGVPVYLFTLERKSQSESFGLCFCGEKDLKNSKKVYINTFNPKGSLSKYADLLQYGDEVLEINGYNLQNRGHMYAINKRDSITDKKMQIVVCRDPSAERNMPRNTPSPSTSDGSGEYVYLSVGESWDYGWESQTQESAQRKYGYLGLPIFLFTLERKNANEHFGFYFCGEKDIKNSKKVYICEFNPKGSLSKYKDLLKYGDEVLEINGFKLQNKGHKYAAILRNTTEGNIIQIIVCRDPSAEENMFFSRYFLSHRIPDISEKYDYLSIAEIWDSEWESQTQEKAREKYRYLRFPIYLFTLKRKYPEEIIGIHFCGEIDLNNSKKVYICAFNPKGCTRKYNGLLQYGDEILEINGYRLQNKGHRVAALLRDIIEDETIQIVVCRNPNAEKNMPVPRASPLQNTSDDYDDYFCSSTDDATWDSDWENQTQESVQRKYGYLGLPIFLFTLERKSRSELFGLCFCGERDTKNSKKVYICAFKPDETLSKYRGLLKYGDEVLEINGHKVLNKGHEAAATLRDNVVHKTLKIVICRDPNAEKNMAIRRNNVRQ